MAVSSFAVHPRYIKRGLEAATFKFHDFRDDPAGECANRVAHVFVHALSSAEWMNLQKSFDVLPSLDLPGFLDFGPDRIRAVLDPNGLELVSRRSKPDVVYLVQQGSSNIAILYRDEAIIDGQFALMRLVRGLVRSRADRSALVPLHASAACLNECGVLVTGAKFAGKTTTLISLLANSQADFISNDQVSLGPDEVVYGWPKAVSVRLGSLRFDGRLERYVRELALGGHVTTGHPLNNLDVLRDFAASTSLEWVNSPLKVRFSPSEFAAIMGRKVIAAAPMRLIVIPVFDTDVSKARLEEVDPTIASRLLSDQMLSSEFWDPWGSPPGDPFHWNEWSKRVVTSTPIVMVRHNEHCLQETADLVTRRLQAGT